MALIYNPKVPSAAPNFPQFTVHSAPKSVENLKFYTTDGQEQHLNAFKGQVCLIVFWATWCAHCPSEIRDFESIAETLEPLGLRILPLSHDTRPGSVEAFYQREKFRNLPIYYDTGMKAARSLGIRGIPTVILIDKQGFEVGRLEGAAVWNSIQAIDFLKYYLEKQ